MSTDSVDVLLSSLPVARPCTQRQFNDAYGLRRVRSSAYLRVVQRRGDWRPSTVVRSLIPLLDWLPRCDASTLWSDLAAGFTVAVIHVPQGMAYGALGGVNPIVGVYMAIFPALVYAVFGTSRHISMGSFAIVCLMAGHIVLLHAGQTSSTSVHTSSSNNTLSTSGHAYSPEEVAASVSIAVGACQVLLGLCKVGSISMFMSEALVSGFTNGAAILVVISQLPHVFGIKIPRHFGKFSAIYTTSEIFQALPNTNFMALAMSVFVILALYVYSDILLPRLKCKCFLPMELIVLIVGTAFSYSIDLKNRYEIHIVGSIPIGVPTPKLPRLDLMPTILFESLTIAIISFSVQISMATMFALKDNYKVRPNQELLACGLANAAGSVFGCLPIGASLSRSMIQYNAGGRTQLATVFSCAMLLTVVLYLGALLEPLPYSVLAGVVIKSLKSMLMQFQHVPSIWRHSSLDGALWVTTFLSVVLLSIELGLAIALALALLTVVALGQRVIVVRLGHALGSQPHLYLETERYPGALAPLPYILIARIVAGLHFANAHVAVRKLDALLAESPDCRVLVLDLSSVTFVDPAALHLLRNYVTQLSRHEPPLDVLLAAPSGRLYEQMTRCDFFSEFPEDHTFISIQDAVMYSSNRPHIMSDEVLIQ